MFSIQIVPIPDVFDSDVVDPNDGVNPDVFDPDDSNVDGSNLARSNPNALNPDRRSSRRRLQARSSALGPSSSNSPKCSRPVDRLMDRHCGPPKNSVETAVNSRKGWKTLGRARRKAWRRSVEAEMTKRWAARAEGFQRFTLRTSGAIYSIMYATR